MNWKTKVQNWLTDAAVKYSEGGDDQLKDAVRMAYNSIDEVFTRYFREKAKIPIQESLAKLVEHHGERLPADPKDLMHLRFIYFPMRNGVTHKEEMMPPRWLVGDFLDLTLRCMDQFRIDTTEARKVLRKKKISIGGGKPQDIQKVYFHFAKSIMWDLSKGQTRTAEDTHTFAKKVFGTSYEQWALSFFDGNLPSDLGERFITVPHAVTEFAARIKELRSPGRKRRS